MLCVTEKYFERRDSFVSMDLLIGSIHKKNNPTVAGLDPKLDFIPQFILDKAFGMYGKTLQGAAAAILEFNKGLIDSFYDIVPAVKPQSAYYEMYGTYGLIAMEETIKYAKNKGLYVILDVKRNDIGTTAEAYSSAYLGMTDICGSKVRAFEPDSVTVNGYLGSDGINPFVDDCNAYDKSIFVLVKTSNPSSGELQDLKLEDGTVYEKMAQLVNGWGAKTVGSAGYSNVGCVVGATYPKQAELLRKIMPNIFFLVPGYGAQGGGATDVAPAFNKDGLGAIVNSSRGIMCAYKKTGNAAAYADAARAECIRMRDELNSVR